MKTLLQILVLNCVFLFAGCGVVRELVPAVREGVENAGPPPIVAVDYVAVGSYVLNVVLGTWAAWERGRRNGSEK